MKHLGLSVSLRPGSDAKVFMSQIKVTEILVDHFATIADGIGETDAELWNLKDFMIVQVCSQQAPENSR